MIPDPSVIASSLSLGLGFTLSQDIRQRSAVAAIEQKSQDTVRLA